MGLAADDLQRLLHASYQKNGDAKRTTAGTGFTLDDKLSDRQQKVFTDSGGKPYVVYTGSRTVTDWLVSDAALALGLERYTPRFIKSRGVLSDVSKKYGQPVTVAGHSLGGAIAADVGRSAKVDRVVTVDKGVGWGGLFTPQLRKETAIRGATDLVSLGNLTQWGGKKITLPQTAFANVHKSHDVGLLRKLKGAQV
jgi:hypothetical protein